VARRPPESRFAPRAILRGGTLVIDLSMRLPTSLTRSLACGLSLSTLLLAACGTVGTVPIDDGARTRLHVVSVNPVVKLPKDITYLGPKEMAAMMLGGPLIGGAIANNIASGPKAALLAELDTSKIAVGDIVAAEFAKQASSATDLKFVVDGQAADAQVELWVNAYGIMHAQPFGSTLYPLLNVSAVMRAPDGKILWQATDIVGATSPENKQGHTIEDYLKDPELLRQAFTTGGDLVGHKLADNFMGREKPQNVPGIQQ
jgi:hypothetical protein